MSSRLLSKGLCSEQKISASRDTLTIYTLAEDRLLMFQMLLSAAFLKTLCPLLPILLC